MWEPQPLTTLRASKACRGENFTFTFTEGSDRSEIESTIPEFDWKDWGRRWRSLARILNDPANIRTGRQLNGRDSILNCLNIPHTSEVLTVAALNSAKGGEPYSFGLISNGMTFQQTFVRNHNLVLRGHTLQLLLHLLLSLTSLKIEMSVLRNVMMLFIYPVANAKLMFCQDDLQVFAPNPTALSVYNCSLSS
jgi:hypothetical protein